MMMMLIGRGGDVTSVANNHHPHPPLVGPLSYDHYYYPSYNDNNNDNDGNWKGYYQPGGDSENNDNCAPTPLPTDCPPPPPPPLPVTHKPTRKPTHKPTRKSQSGEGTPCPTRIFINPQTPE